MSDFSSIPAVCLGAVAATMRLAVRRGTTAHKSLLAAMDESRRREAARVVARYSNTDEDEAVWPGGSGT